MPQSSARGERGPGAHRLDEDWRRGAGAGIHAALSAQEEALLGRLAVFRGSCTLDAAAHVCSGGIVSSAAVASLLGGLVSKSLVVRSAGELADASISRYRLRPDAEAYAAAVLRTAGDTAELHDRHLAWATDLAATAQVVGTTTEEGAARLVALDAEHANVGAAFDFAIQAGQVEAAARLAVMLTPWFAFRLRLAEGRRWLDATTNSAQQCDAALRAMARWASGLFSCLLTDQSAAWMSSTEAFELGRELGDERVVGRALMTMGLCALSGEGESSPRAADLLQRALGHARDAGDPWCVVTTHGALAWLAGRSSGSAPHEHGSAPLVLHLHTGTAALAERLLNLGREAAGEQGAERAGAVLGDACWLAATVGEVRSLVRGLNASADMARRLGDLEQARALYSQSCEVCRRNAMRSSLVEPLCRVGEIDEAEDLAGARRLYSEAAAVSWECGSEPSRALVGLGRVLAKQGDWRMAAATLEPFAAAESPPADTRDVIEALDLLGRCRRSAGDVDAALGLHRRALAAAAEAGLGDWVRGSLEALAGLAAVNWQPAYAALLFGAASALPPGARQLGGDGPLADPAGDFAALTQALPADILAAAWEEGRAMAPDDAVAIAVSGPSAGQRPPTGRDSLTDAERRVARLVAEGLTNREIGERLGISRRTVQTHVAHAFTKLGVRSRRELSRREGSQSSADAGHDRGG